MFLTTAMAHFFEKLMEMLPFLSPVSPHHGGDVAGGARVLLDVRRARFGLQLRHHDQYVLGGVDKRLGDFGVGRFHAVLGTPAAGQCALPMHGVIDV